MMLTGNAEKNRTREESGAHESHAGLNEPRSDAPSAASSSATTRTSEPVTTRARGVKISRSGRTFSHS